MRPLGLVNTWTLTLHLDRLTTDEGVEILDAEVRDVADLEARSAIVAESFIWRRRGAILTVRTQGDPAPLVRIGQWALDSMGSPEPTGFALERMRLAPLRLAEGWRGYVRD